MTPEAARTKALSLGGKFMKEHRQIFDAFREDTEFTYLTCSEVQTWESYPVHHQRLLNLFATDHSFRLSVEAFGADYHRKHAADLTEADQRYPVQRSSDYFLEEFAIFSCLQECKLSVMVYPGSFSTLTEIVSGQHASVPTELRQLIVVSLNISRTLRKVVSG